MTKRVLYNYVLSEGQQDFLSDNQSGVDRYRCFTQLCRMAVMEPTEYQKRGFSVQLQVGQAAASEVELATVWKCNRKTVSRLLDNLNRLGLVASESNNRTTIHTLRCLRGWYVGSKAVVNPNYSDDRLAVDSQNAAGGSAGAAIEAAAATDESAMVQEVQTEVPTAGVDSHEPMPNVGKGALLSLPSDGTCPEAAAQWPASTDNADETDQWPAPQSDDENNNVPQNAAVDAIADTNNNV